MDYIFGMMVVLVVVVVSLALMAGALWGIYGELPERWEGFLVAVAGGALVYSIVSELIEPALEDSELWWVLISVTAGAVVFTVADYLIDEVWAQSEGGGLMAAITLDGVPENLALGVALIGAGFGEVAALAGSIFLSNLPEAAGGSKEMVDGGMGKKKVLLMWGVVAILLSGAALVGNFLMRDLSDAVLGNVRGFAAGAVVASLATEVFPKAFKKDMHWAGVATVLGFVLAIVLGQI